MCVIFVILLRVAISLKVQNNTPTTKIHFAIGKECFISIIIILFTAIMSTINGVYVNLFVYESRMMMAF